MTQMRTYIDLYAQRFDDARYEWGGTSHRNILLKSGENVGDLIGVSDYELQLSEMDGIQINQLFVLPAPIDFVSVIDGTISGSIVVHIRSSVSDEATYLTKIEVDVVKINASGDEITIKTIPVFEGNKVVYENSETLGYMFWADISEVSVSASERLGIRAKTYGRASGNAGVWDMHHRLELTKNATDLSISIPTL
jgi:hypothetical protein